MKTTLVINPKGGAGKTTLAINLASYFASSGISTTVMDYDPQHPHGHRRQQGAPLDAGLRAAAAAPRLARAKAAGAANRLRHLHEGGRERRRDFRDERGGERRMPPVPADRGVGRTGTRPRRSL